MRQNYDLQLLDTIRNSWDVIILWNH